MTMRALALEGSDTGDFTPYPRDVGLDELFERRVRERPEAVAIDAGTERITYAELSARATRIARSLQALGVREETPVGVFMGPRVGQIVAQVAICRAGGTYVPLDPELPRERIEFMLADAGVSVVITDSTVDDLPLGGRARLCIEGEEPAPADAAAPPPLAGAAELRTHILYTSGSTGRPKGIEIVARNVSRLVLATDYVRIEPDDRIAQLASFSFDAAIFEVWGALLNGATVVLIAKTSALDPSALRAALVRHDVTVMFMTTALFNLTAQSCPDAFRTLRYLLVGGERADARTMRAVLDAAPPRHFLHVYGPTEGTTFSTACELDRELVSSPTVPIGRPIRYTQAFVLDAERRPVAAGETGELYLGGDGLARGYLQPHLTAERFVAAAGLVPGRPIRLYRTGDVVRLRPDGMLEFVGRTDFQVKIRGYRIELEEIEAAALASGLVGAVAVTVQESGLGDKLLVAHVVPREPATFRPEALQQELQEKLPHYMVPARYEVRTSMPLSSTGKIDRTLLAGEPRSEATPQDALSVVIAALWAALLGVAKVGPDDDFFRLGGTSLLAARLVLQVRELLHVECPIYALYESGSLREFVASVRAAQQGKANRAAPRDERATWRADAVLADDVAAAIARADAHRGALLGDGDRVFLTGATGFLGAFLLRDLLARPDARVHCLVRAADPTDGMLRLRRALEKYGIWQEGFARRIAVITGDLRLPRLGLDPRAFAALADAVDVIIHSGAQVSYVQPYSAHRRTNVGGTTEVLRLAATGRLRPIHHVSSIAVFGPSGFFDGKRRVFEDQDLDEHLEYLRFDIGYSPSKWVAEKLVWEAARAGLPVTVVRPGFIMGDSRTGASNHDDFVARSARGAIQVGAYPDLPRQRKEFVPVDYVSRALLGIAARADSRGRAFHLVPPDPRRSVDMNTFFELIRECGYPLERVGYASWVERVTADARTRESPLCSLIPMLFERVYRERLTRWELYENMPEYDTSATSAALPGLEVPEMTRALVAKHLLHWARAGHLLPPPRSAPREERAEERPPMTPA